MKRMSFNHTMDDFQTNQYPLRSRSPSAMTFWTEHRNHIILNIRVRNVSNYYKNIIWTLFIGSLIFFTLSCNFSADTKPSKPAIKSSTLPRMSSQGTYNRLFYYISYCQIINWNLLTRSKYDHWERNDQQSQ